MQLYDLIDAEPYLSFHNAKFERVCLDFVANEVAIQCVLCVGDPDAPTVPEREARRHGTLTLTGLRSFVIEPPHPDYSFETTAGLDITADGSLASLSHPSSSPLDVPDEEAFAHYFFVGDWNARLTVAATGARFAWD